MHILYKLTFLSGKCYIGQTVRALPIRISAHRAAANRGSKLPVHEAWRKYGDPIIEVIGEYDTHDELHAAEISQISAFGTISPGGYNISVGGDTAPSKNPVVAAKIAEKARGRKASEETIKVFSEASKKKWEVEGYREKVSAGLRASWTDERRAEHAEITRGIMAKRKADGLTGHSEETKAKLRGRVVSAETRAKMSTAAKGKKKAPRSEKARAKFSENAKRQAKDPDLMARRGAAIRAALLARTPEQIAASEAKRLASRAENKRKKETEAV